MRLFLAIPLPISTVARLGGYIESVRSHGEGTNARWVEPASLHVTLHFLGEQSDERAQRVELVAARVAAETSAFDFQLLGEDTFPDESNPRVLFIGIAAGRASLIALAERLQRSLAVDGFAAEPRPFHPHVTLARTSGRRFDRELDRSVEFGYVRCDRVLLMESRGGYHERRAFPLR